ncbi:hypothetical protein LOD99_4928 [Oopsacas minuta]|uniref:Uncharacterized protein n=1 Tax=Oopsacas minuta TaxID=111878 RepID=A0AAV7JTE7_9METZ|nr:hypothetical protein LOD99_4928 [Oopsacas minuta]
MTEDLEVVQLSQLQTDKQYYNMGYREACQSALEVEDQEAKKIGFHLGYILIEPHAKLEGYTWVLNSLGIEMEGKLPVNIDAIESVLEKIQIETQPVEESAEIRKILHTRLTAETTQQIIYAETPNSNKGKIINLQECMKKLEIRAGVLSPT